MGALVTGPGSPQASSSGAGSVLALARSGPGPCAAQGTPVSGPGTEAPALTQNWEQGTGSPGALAPDNPEIMAG